MTTGFNLAFPYHFDPGGRTAGTDDISHINELIEQLLFTVPGERVNRPDFGSGVAQLIFAPNSTELASATQYLLQGALQQVMGDVIDVKTVEVTANDNTLTIRITYVVRVTQQQQVTQFTRTTTII